MLTPDRAGRVRHRSRGRSAPAGCPGTIPASNPAPPARTPGFQHYEFGLEATFGLNDLLNIPARYGKLDFKGYLFYTDGIDNELRADTELYGGVGIGFSY